MVGVCVLSQAEKRDVTSLSRSAATNSSLVYGQLCVHLSLLASLSDSKRARMSPFLTGPFTFLTKLLVLLAMKTTFTCVIPPLDPIVQEWDESLMTIMGCGSLYQSARAQNLPVLPMISLTSAYVISPWLSILIVLGLR